MRAIRLRSDNPSYAECAIDCMFVTDVRWHPNQTVEREPNLEPGLGVYIQPRLYEPEIPANAVGTERHLPPVGVRHLLPSHRSQALTPAGGHAARRAEDAVPEIAPTLLVSHVPYWPRLSAISTRAISTRRVASARSSDSSCALRLASSSRRLASATSISPKGSAASARTITW